MTTRKEYPGGVIVEDYGSLEYLDGAQMQFCVVGKSGTLAYFDNKNDAVLFAKAKAAGLKG